MNWEYMQTATSGSQSNFIFRHHAVLLTRHLTSMASRPSQPLELDGQCASVQEYIENQLVAFIHELSLPAAEARLSISLKRRANPTSCIINPITGALDASSRVESMKTYSWPGKTVYEEWKFGAYSLLNG